MRNIPGMLIIGGNARNIGKTTLACRIIKEFSDHHDIIGLKIVTHRKGDENYHGTKEKELTDEFKIFEEKNAGIPKDTARMLRAGAKKVFMIRTKEQFLKEAINKFFSMINSSNIFVCESNSLNNIIKAGVYLMVKSPYVENEKQSARKLEKIADMVILSEQNSVAIENIDINLKLLNDKWILNNT